MAINAIHGTIIPYTAVLYQTDPPITDHMHVLCHGNIKENQSRPNILIDRQKFCLRQKIY